MSKDTRIAFRTTADLKRRLAKVASVVRLNETQLAQACVEALVEYIEEHGEIRLPLAVIPKKRPAPFPSTAVAHTPRQVPSLNEDAAQASAVPNPSPKPPKLSKTRAALRVMTAKEKRAREN